MLGRLVLSTETQTQLCREYSRKSSLPLVSRPFLGESVPQILAAAVQVAAPQFNDRVRSLDGPVPC